MRSRAKWHKPEGYWALAFFVLVPLALHAPVWTGRVDFFSGPASDLVPYVYGLKQFQYQSLHQYRELPLWNPHLLLGQPALGNIQHALFYPLNALFWVFPFFTAVWIGHVIHMAIAGLGAWLLARRTGCGPAAALTAGGLFMLNGRMLYYINAGWMGYLHALSWIPWVVWAGIGMARDPKPGRAALTGVFLALSLLSGTPQYALMGYCLLALMASLPLTGGPGGRVPRWPLAVCVALCGAVFFSLSAIELFPSAQQGFLSSRPLSAGQSLGFNLSWDLAQWVRILVRPVFAGHDFAWELCGYIGIGGLVLALYGIGSSPGRWRFVLVWGVIPLLLSLGPSIPFLDRALQGVPGLSMLVSPSRYFIFTILCLSLAAGWGLQGVLDRRLDPRRSAAILAALLLAGGAAMAVPAAGPGGPAANLRLMAAVLLSGLFILACAFRPNRVRAWVLVGWLLVDPLMLAPALLTGYRRADLEAPSRILAALAGDPRPARLAVIQPESLRHNLISVIEDHETLAAGIDRIDGYEPLAMLRTLRFLTRMDGTPPPDRAWWGFRPFGFGRPDLFALAGVTHLAATELLDRPGLTLVAADRITRPHFRGGWWQDQPVFLYEIDSALPGAFHIGPDGRRTGAPVTLERPSPNRRQMVCRAAGAGTLILAESFHDGWQVRVDGAAARARPFLDTFIAVDIGPGEHHIDLRFLPAAYVTGRRITLAGLGGLLVFLGYGILGGRRAAKGRQKGES